jgi:hypothetical protein
MSDHRDGGLDNWEEGTLPGTPAIGTSYANSESLLKPSCHIPYHQRGPLNDRSNARIPTGQWRGDPARDKRFPRRPSTNGIPGRSTGVESRQVRPAPPHTDPAPEIIPNIPPCGQESISVVCNELALQRFVHDAKDLSDASSTR